MLNKSVKRVFHCITYSSRPSASASSNYNTFISRNVSFSPDSSMSSDDFNDSFGATLKPVTPIKRISLSPPGTVKDSPAKAERILSILRSDQFSSFTEKENLDSIDGDNNHQQIEIINSSLPAPRNQLIEKDINIIESSPIENRVKVLPVRTSPYFPQFKKRLASPISKTPKRAFSTSNNDYSLFLATQKPTTPQPEKGFKPIPKSVKALILSAEQEAVLKMVMEGTSLFYTGSAGTGKSVLLRAIIKSLKNKYSKGKVAVTASTGLAACNIGGITVHNFAGVGLAQGTMKTLLKKIRKNRKALNRWRDIKVLVIDEISMIDGKFFNILNELAQTLRRNNEPFGGIQLVVCGDFFQLPPVSKSVSVDGEVVEKEEAMFAFESKSWEDAIKETIILKEVFRQKGDQQFIDMLNDMRTGKVSEETDREFRKLTRSLSKVDGIEPAELFCTRWEVDYANNKRLKKLTGQTKVYTSEDSGSLPPENRQTILNNILAPQKLFLKKNAQVMCIKNFDETLVNGSLGQVIGFMNRDTYMHYELRKEHPELSPEEIKTLAENKKKEKGEDLKIEDSNDENLTDSIFDFLKEVPVSADAHGENIQRKKDLLEKLHSSTNVERNKYPLVRFLLPDGINTREVLVEPELWNIEDENMNVLAKRVQLPLILAWSLSIHKSQGQTLPKVKVDLRRVFENGQAYVALSRATSREGLQVLHFDRYKIKTHPKVIQFYKSLSSAGEVKKKGQQKLGFKYAVA